MCGIIGYVGPRQSQDILLAGLSRLEYRGYDSAGIAVIDGDGQLDMRKRAGKLAVLRDDLESTPMPNGTTGIGHTRWATHGGPTDANAHPHLADDDKLAVIHNGIIENFAELKSELVGDGFAFRSETDTEVAAVMIGREYARTKDLVQAFRSVVSRLEGAYTLLAMHEDHPGLVVGARRNSPLVIGLGEGENFLGSDVAAFVEHTRNALAIGQDEIVAITPEGVEVTDFSGAPVEVEAFEVTWDASAPRRAAGRRSWPRRSRRSPRPSPTPSAAASTRAVSRSPNSRGWTTSSPTSIASSSSRAAPPPTRAWSASTPSRPGPVFPSTSSWRTSSATATPCSPPARWSCRSASRARPWTRSWPSSTRARAVRRRCRSATRRGRRFRASPTRSSTPTRVPRWPSPRPRPSSRRSPPCTCWPCTWVACAARSTRWSPSKP